MSKLKALSCMFKYASAAAITALLVVKCAKSKCFFRFTEDGSLLVPDLENVTDNQ